MKIRTFAPAFLIAALFFSCTSKEKTGSTATPVDSSTSAATPEMRAVKIDARKIGPEKSEEQIQIENAIEKLEANKNNPVVGYWVGAFGKNKINIAIAEIQDNKALGYTVCAGNFRPITGSVKNNSDSVYTFTMDEPGTDQYDGHFEFTIRTSSNQMKGTWSPFKKGAASAKTFVLHKTDFVYSTDHGIFEIASQRVLEESDVYDLALEELALMRNEIYARHGYSFKDKEMRAYFDTTAWYVPMGIDIRDNLTDVEVQNIDLIYVYEKYQEEHYDDYGR
ncbi:YARHG domain-containing protein [Pseudochryseolinea flava]|nr:YARHG domain-containing protein [Pseudochryseolinea flava]